MNFQTLKYFFEYISLKGFSGQIIRIFGFLTWPAILDIYSHGLLNSYPNIPRPDSLVGSGFKNKFNLMNRNKLSLDWFQQFIISICKWFSQITCVNSFCLRNNSKEKIILVLVFHIKVFNTTVGFLNSFFFE